MGRMWLVSSRQSTKSEGEEGVGVGVRGGGTAERGVCVGAAVAATVAVWICVAAFYHLYNFVSPPL